MLRLRGIDDPSACRNGFLSIGNFDGVHRGHQAIFRELVRQARDAAVPAVAVTFDPHPITLLAPHRAPPSLSTLDHRAELIARCGVDVLIVLETTQELLHMSPEQFFETFVLKTFDARGLVEGQNFYFGKDRGGDIERLQGLCRSAGRRLTVVPPVDWGNETVSSSSIRQCIQAGRLSDAVARLGHAYRISGLVDRGAGRGGPLGFPTANLTEVATLLPPDGVYAGIACVPASRVGDVAPPAADTHEATASTIQGRPAAVHLGPNPTFSESDRKLEVHLVGFQGDLYGRPLHIDLIDRIRETRKFETRDALQAQLQQDVAEVVHRCQKWTSAGDPHGLR